MRTEEVTAARRRGIEERRGVEERRGTTQRRRGIEERSEERCGGEECGERGVVVTRGVAGT